MSPAAFHRRKFIGSVVLWSAVLSGCVAPQRPLPPPLTNADVGDTQWLAEVEKPSDRILKGFDPPQKSDTWQVGSEVLYSVRIEGRGPVLTRFVHIKLQSMPLKGIKTLRINPTAPARNAEVFDIHDPGEKPGELPVKSWIFEGSARSKGQSQQTPTDFKITSDAVAVRMALYDESGQRLESHYALLPEAHLRQGLVQLAEWSATLDPAAVKSLVPTPEQMTWIYKAQAALYSFGAIIKASPVAKPLMKQIIPRTMLLGIWLFGGTNISFELGQATRETRQLPALAPDRTGWQLPLTISINGNRTLQCRITVTPPDSPFDLCAGVVAFEGLLIDRPERRFQMHLIAARRAVNQPTSRSRE